MPQLFVVILGQSNAGFYGDKILQGCPWPGQVGYNYLDGTFAPYVEPFPGWTTPGNVGSGGSIWGRAGYLLGDNPWSMIVWAPLIKEGSSSAMWRPGGACFPRIGSLRSAWAAHAPPFKPSLYIWLNGETDGNDVSMAYGYHTDSVRQMVQAIRDAGDCAPVFACQASACRIGTGPDFGLLTKPDRLARLNRQAEFQLEQSRLPDELCSLGVHRGFNMDLISLYSRFDWCHLASDAGQWTAAEMTQDMLLKAHAAGVI